MSCLTCIWATRNQSLKRCYGSVSVFWHVTSNKNTLKDITDLVPDGNIETTPPCELSDLRSVGACINKIKASGNKFDALIFNAGIDGAPFQKTAQGHELHFAVNHLSHFALWNGLIFGLKQWPFCFFQICCLFSDYLWIWWNDTSKHIKLPWPALLDWLADSIFHLIPRIRKDAVKDDHRVVSVTSSAALDAEVDLSDLTWEKRLLVTPMAAKSKSTLPWATRWHYIATFILYIYVMQSYWTGSLNYSIHIERIKQCNLYRNLDGFALISALFQLVSYDDPCKK